VITTFNGVTELARSPSDVASTTVLLATWVVTVDNMVMDLVTNSMA
jgi:hypothetical protein